MQKRNPVKPQQQLLHSPKLEKKHEDQIQIKEPSDEIEQAILDL